MTMTVAHVDFRERKGAVTGTAKGARATVFGWGEQDRRKYLTAKEGKNNL